MTIFDVIKYPISDPPTVDELRALPDELYNRWISQSQWASISDRGNRRYIASWYREAWSSESMQNYPHCYDNDIADIARLKQLIRDYDAI